MAHLDLNWLYNLGYSHLSEDEAQSLLTAVESEFQLRSGNALSENMTDEQLKEFGKINHGDVVFAAQWVEAQGIDPETDQGFITMRELVLDCGDMQTGFCDWAAGKWLEVQRPDYREVVIRCRQQLEAELRENAKKVATEVRG